MNNESLSWVPNIKFLCFDVDGTLYRNVPEAWNAIQDQIYNIVAKQRLLNHKQAAKYVKQRYQELGSSTKVLNELGIDGEEFFTKAFGKIDLTKFVSKDIKLIKLISKLREKYILGIISNTHFSIADKKLSAIGLSLADFNPLITTYEFGFLKPDPAAFLKALELAKVTPESAVYIGNSVESDVLGAKSVGMRTVLVWSESKEADLSIPTIYDLEGIFL